MLLFEYLLRKSIAKALEKSYNKNRMIMYRYEKGRSLIVKRTTESYPLSGSQRNIWGLEHHRWQSGGLIRRRDVLAHRFAVLSGDRGEADRGWSAARSESDEAVYDGDVDGSGYPRRLRWSFLNGSGAGLNRNLAVLAGWLADRSHDVGVLLPCGEAAALRYPAGSDPAGNASRRNGGGMDRK